MGLIIPPQLIQGLHASTEFPLDIPGTPLGCALHGLTLPILLDPLLIHGSYTHGSSASGGC